ncbi:MAG: 4Fe-4S dicluster domain-containing protein [Gemmatimonadota bacterium]
MLACKEINGLPKDTGPELSSTTWTSVWRQQGLNVRRQCMHCLDPACASVCPVAALERRPEGPVVYHEDRCMGCRYCMVACPFGVPKYEWEKVLPRVQKCIMCYDKRVKQGRQPACAEACPTGATAFGERDALIREAGDRIRQHPDRYLDHVYGVREAGGTSVLYLSSVSFADLGFPGSLEQEPYPRLTWNILSKLPNVVATGGVLMMGLWWITKRRNELGGLPPRSHGGGGTGHGPTGEGGER